MPPASWSMAARYRLQPQGTTLSPEALKRLGALPLKKTAGGYTWKFDWRCMRRPYEPIWPLLPKIKTPALIAAVAQAKTAIVAKAHHHVPLDEPRALAEVLLDFLA